MPNQLVTLTPIPERSEATPGLWNSRFAQIDSNLTALQVPGVFNVLNYGASNTSSADAYSAFVLAVTAAQNYPNGVVLIPPGDYLLSGLVSITKPIAFEGFGPRQTKFFPMSSSTFSNYILEVNDVWRNNAEDKSSMSSVNLNVAKAGVQIGGFGIYGNRNFLQKGFRTFDRVDYLNMHDVMFEYLNGTALDLGSHSSINAIVRESNFHNIHVRNSGSTTEYAMIITNGNSAGDGTNELEFHDLYVVYSYGTGLYLGSNSGATAKNIRRIRFHSFMCHGRNNLADAPACDNMFITGDVSDSHFFGLGLNGSPFTNATSYACLRISRLTNDDLSVDKPQRLTFDGLDIKSSQGHGIVLDLCGACVFNGTVQASAISGNELRVEAGSVVLQGTYNLKGGGTRSIYLNDTAGNLGWGGTSEVMSGFYTNTTLSASQTSIVLTDALSPGGRLVTRDGSLVAIMASLSSARTGGQLTVVPQKSTDAGITWSDFTTTSSSSCSVIFGSTVTTKSQYLAKYDYAVNAGDRVRGIWTTNGAWGPSANTLQVTFQFASD